RLGVSFKYMGTSAQAQLAYSATNEQHTITAYFKQVMYEAYIVPPQTPAEFFSTSFTNEKLQEQVNLGNIGSNNLPVYVGKIQYGRMMMFTMTSSAHTDSMKMAIEGSYSGFTQYSVEVQASLRNILQSSEYTIISIGGPASTVLDMIKSGNLNDYFKTDASLTTAVPLAYTLYNLADGSIATVSETTEYDVRECSALNAQCYLNKTEWQMAIAELVGEGHIIEFPTTPENVALANEVASLPNENDILGTILTFDSASTQLPFTFSLKPGVSGYRLQYKADRWISVGLVGVEEDDVFDIRIPEWNDNAAVFAIGIDIGDNWREPDEEGLYVYGVDGFEKRFLGVAPNHPETFLGVVATVPLTTFHFNEGDVNDDIFVRDFYFGVLEWSD
ncbi:MAG: thiol-activated cytolysin family protein, partial [candidate division Zixibacteria bacterium]|nr:thiol-activated cytolysin family protein [candidate division Zixibacteria bacterium]